MEIIASTIFNLVMLGVAIYAVVRAYRCLTENARLARKHFSRIRFASIDPEQNAKLHEKFPKEVHDTLDYVIEIGSANGDTVMFPDGFEGVLIGYMENNTGHIVAVYDYDKSIEYMATHLINETYNGEKLYETEDDAYTGAVEWFETNTLRALPYVTDSNGDNVAPVFVYTRN